ncbi:uncharacterized protein [Drosophila kikkawai]|uniref:Uncharacterized protein isoform X2 n=1 Tax=Drosophila kikkawai TaxID=30033 RepID=A0A6P4IAU9_DROKI|nr:uncharacterized protein LOC108073692 isoform X2 [Drosophila kikkawai]
MSPIPIILTILKNIVPDRCVQCSLCSTLWRRCSTCSAWAFTSPASKPSNWISLSINICTGHTPTITLELIKTSAATVAFLAVSLGTMWDAERQFYMFGHDPEQEHSSTKYINYEPVHPFFVYMRSQSISALACSVLYLLHTCLMFDYKLTQKRSNSDESYMPISLFVFGRWVHTKLETYEWFKEFSSNDYIRV